MSNAELLMNSEKAMLAKYILSIDNESTLSKVKNCLSVFIHIDDTKENKTDKVLSAIAKGWEDTKTADEMVCDIYSARRNSDNYTNPFEI